MAIANSRLTPPEAARRAERALRQSVEIAEQARALYASRILAGVWIAASLGPYGAALHNGAEYHGRYAIAFDDLVAFHAGRLAILADTNAGLLAFETIPSLDEPRPSSARSNHIPRSLHGSPSPATTPPTSPMASLFAIALRALAVSPQVAAIGINCTAPSLITPLIIESRFGHSDRKPTIVYPNSGETWDPATRNWRGHADSTQFGLLAREWFRAGAQAIGGCCRTGPAHIAAVARAARASIPAASS